MLTQGGASLALGYRVWPLQGRTKAQHQDWRVGRVSVPRWRVGLVWLACFVLLVSATPMVCAAEADQPTVELLWPEGAPGALGPEDVDRPSLTIHLAPAEKRVGTGVVVCPGGGYRHLAVDHEGRQVAEWLNGLGVSAFVLKYRLGPRYQHPAPMNDVQRALRIVRSRAAEFGVESDRIGVLGFSAGGHLASTAATHFDAGRGDVRDPVEQVSCRPDFAVLVYPVISFTTRFTHEGSRRNLLGDGPDPKLVESLSNEKQVTRETPPTFLMHTSGDTGVPAENSVLFYLALRRVGVPAEMHIYEQGRHGFGLAQQDPVLSTWPARCADWLRGRGMLPSAESR